MSEKAQPLSVDIDDRREWIQGILNRLEMVEWDRFVTAEFDSGRIVNVYGWIDRDDGYKDFVLVEFYPDDGENGHIGFTTSSDEYSQEIHNLIFGEDSDTGHNPCHRVEYHLDVDNAVNI